MQRLDPRPLRVHGTTMTIRTVHNVVRNFEMEKGKNRKERKYNLTEIDVACCTKYMSTQWAIKRDNRIILTMITNVLCSNWVESK